VLEQQQEFEAQTWPFEPGDRTVKMYVREPAGGVTPNTGMMLVLHCWGGRYDEQLYLGWCEKFGDRYNVITASVNYLQSAGAEPWVLGALPYDHGYLQAMDAVRALYHIAEQLSTGEVAFNPRRCYAMGISGGGNVTLMANKLAPHTFACVADHCGMPGLTDAIAYGAGEYGSHLNAGYSQDPLSPAHLTKDMQQMRDPGDPAHLRIQFAANPDNKVIIIHGLDDRSCPVVHKITVFRNMVDAGFRPDGHFLSQWHVHSTPAAATEHSMGDHAEILPFFADAYMLEKGELALELSGRNDFERGGQVEYPTQNGRYVVNYSGVPSVRFEGSSEG